MATAPSTAVAWRRALKAIGVDTTGLHVRTLYLRSTCRRADGTARQVSEPISKYASAWDEDAETLTARAGEFTDLVKASGWSAHVILRGSSRHRYVQVINGLLPLLESGDRLLATTDQR